MKNRLYLMAIKLSMSPPICLIIVIKIKNNNKNSKIYGLNRTRLIVSITA